MSDHEQTLRELAGHAETLAPVLGPKSMMDDLRAACLSGAEALAREKQTCAWTEDEDGVWHTGCGTAWCSEVGGAPADHKMRFCYHCGVTLAAGPFQATREAE